MYALQPNVTAQVRSHIGEAAVSAAKVTCLIILLNIVLCDFTDEFHYSSFCSLLLFISCAHGHLLDSLR
jgi:hypothetical protein